MASRGATIRRRATWALGGLLLAGLGLAGAAPARDWRAHPAILRLGPWPRIVAVGDVHGARRQLVATLRAAGLLRWQGRDWRWAGGRTLLVLTGDYVDRGPESLEVLELLQRLEAEAPASGGRVVALMGNHEAMLLAGEVEFRARAGDPVTRSEYQATLTSLARRGQPRAQLLGPEGAVGAFLRRLPLLALVDGRHAFVHGGFGRVPSLPRLEAAFRDAVDREAWDDPLLLPTTAAAAAASPLWARDWWGRAGHVGRVLRALGCERLVFGHTCEALASEPRGWGQVLTDGRLYKVDVGMTPSYGHSQGGALELTEPGGRLTARALYPDRVRERLRVEARPRGRGEEP